MIFNFEIYNEFVIIVGTTTAFILFTFITDVHRPRSSMVKYQIWIYNFDCLWYNIMHNNLQQ